MLVYSKDIYAVAIFAVVYRYSSNYKANKKETTTRYEFLVRISTRAKLRSEGCIFVYQIFVLFHSHLLTQKSFVSIFLKYLHKYILCFLDNALLVLKYGIV